MCDLFLRQPRMITDHREAAQTHFACSGHIMIHDLPNRKLGKERERPDTSLQRFLRAFCRSSEILLCSGPAIVLKVVLCRNKCFHGGTKPPLLSTNIQSDDIRCEGVVFVSAQDLILESTEFRPTGLHQVRQSAWSGVSTRY